MIVRIFQVTARDDQIKNFHRFFVDTALPLVQAQPGLVSVTAGLPRAETTAQFSMVMVWENTDALRAFAGENWRQPHIHPDEAVMVETRTLAHYDLVDG